MGLLDLPPEILDLIIDATLPNGLESFVLTCKAVSERAQTQVVRHNQLKRRWSRTTNASPSRRGDTLDIIYEISRDPIIADYIASLNLWDRRTADQVQRKLNGYDFRYDELAMSNIKTFLQRTALFSADGENYDWWTRILDEDTATDDLSVDKLYATVTLLTLLPHLKTLQLPDRWHEVRKEEAAEYLVPAVEALVTMSNKSSSPRRALASLETILPFVEEGYDVRASLQCLQPFMCLKSIRNLFAVSCVAVENDWNDVPFEWTLTGAKSPLTRIELASCCIDSRSLSVLLANTPAVTVFRYSHQTKWDGLEHDWNPGAFLEVIANYLGEQLVELAITIDELHGQVINGLSSFMRFIKLEKLEVDVQPFCGPPLESGQRLGRNSYLPPGATPWSHVDIPCMGDMLPVSIRELHVNTDYPEPAEDALRALFKNIKDRREDKLVFLAKTVIRQYRSSSARELAERHDCLLESFEENVSNPRPRFMMPQWKRNFDVAVGGIVTTSVD
ncbi:hypothetical protein ACEQ8H_005062 [Pleosporales sp. CAS-2024a]